MELALGTVQFGLAYGVAGRGEAVPEAEARAILHRAHELGIRTLDTAAAYGDIEQRLSRLIDNFDFSVMSKIPAKPPDVEGQEAIDWARRALRSSMERLGKSLRGVMFHSADDLLGPDGESLWQACRTIAAPEGIALGVSCYEPQSLLEIIRRGMPIAIAQLPGNALDQRLRDAAARLAAPANVEIHLRSVFLQGLLLMPERQAAEKIPAASAALRRWHVWCNERGMAPLRAALAIAKGLPGVRYCVVGVDGVDQLEQIAAQWHGAPTLVAHELAEARREVIDPRCWPVH